MAIAGVAFVCLLGSCSGSSSSKSSQVAPADLSPTTTSTLPAPDCTIRSSGADLHGCDLANQLFTRDNLNDASFDHANLTGANLSKAQLVGVRFTSARLTDADLATAYAYGADFTGADLSATNVKGIKWVHTICPDLTSSDDHESTCEGHLF